MAGSAGRGCAPLAGKATPAAAPRFAFASQPAARSARWIPSGAWQARARRGAARSNIICAESSLLRYDVEAYRARNLIERAFCRLKDWRRIATSYDKLAINFASAVAIAAVVIWWT